jgi:hypothetical protein
MVLAPVQYVQNVDIDIVFFVRRGTTKGGGQHPRRV